MLPTIFLTGIAAATDTSGASNPCGDLATLIAAEIARTSAVELSQPCTDMGTHLESLVDGQGNLIAAPDMDQICPCLSGLGEDFAESSLTCQLSAGLEAKVFWDTCQPISDGGSSGGGGDPVDCDSDEAANCLTTVLTECGGCAVDPTDQSMCPGSCASCAMYGECFNSPVDCESDDAATCMDSLITECGGCAVDPSDSDLCPVQCTGCAMYAECLGGDVDCDTSEANTCLNKLTSECAGCAVDMDDDTMCPGTCDACLIYAQCLGDGEPTGEPTWEPTTEPTSICNIDTLSSEMTSAFIRGEVAPSYIQACQATGAHLRAISDGLGGLLDVPDYPLVCSCLIAFEDAWAAEHLDCMFGDGIKGDEVHYACKNGGVTNPPTEEPAETPAPTEEEPAATPAPTDEPAAPTAEPTEAKTFTLSWDVRLCCMAREECEATGDSLQSILGGPEVKTTCTAVSSSRRRNTGDDSGGQTWDARYEMDTTEDEATNLQGYLNQQGVRDAIKSQIESDTGATVSAFDAEPAEYKEKKGSSGGDSGVAVPVIVGIVAGLAVLGGGAAFLCYKKGKQPTENQKSMSPRLLNDGGFEPIPKDLENGTTRGGETDM